MILIPATVSRRQGAGRGKPFPVAGTGFCQFKPFKPRETRARERRHNETGRGLQLARSCTSLHALIKRGYNRAAEVTPQERKKRRLRGDLSRSVAETSRRSGLVRKGFVIKRSGNGGPRVTTHRPPFVRALISTRDTQGASRREIAACPSRNASLRARYKRASG